MKFYTTGEVSRRLNLSVRTLRYYDGIGLLSPQHKDPSGKRYYSEEDVVTLEKISLLKSLHLPLNEIQDILAQVTMEDLLQAHKRSLTQQMQEIEASLAHTNTLLNMIRLEGGVLSWEQLLTLVKQANSGDKKKLAWGHYFTEEEQMELRDHLPAMQQDDPLIKKWIEVIARIENRIAQGINPSSDEAIVIAEDVILLSEETFGGNRQLEEKFWEIRKSVKDSEKLQLYPVKAEVIAFLEQAIIAAELKRAR